MTNLRAQIIKLRALIIQLRAQIIFFTPGFDRITLRFLTVLFCVHKYGPTPPYTM